MSELRIGPIVYIYKVKPRKIKINNEYVAQRCRNFLFSLFQIISIFILLFLYSPRALVVALNTHHLMPQHEFVLKKKVTSFFFFFLSK
jgi:hypothetical protein